MTRRTSALSVLLVLAPEERVAAVVSDPTIWDILGKEDRDVREELERLRRFVAAYFERENAEALLRRARQGMAMSRANRTVPRRAREVEDDDEVLFRGALAACRAANATWIAVRSECRALREGAADAG